MRRIDNIVIHCTAGYGNVDAIKRFWREKLGWKQPGYHYFIYEDGKVENLAPLSVITNGVKGFNSNSVHIAYQGGVLKDNVNKAQDTRTPAQKKAIIEVIQFVLQELSKYQDISSIEVKGHRDFSPDKNKNAIIDSWERIKECPSFDAIPEYKGILRSHVFSVLFLMLMILAGCKSSGKVSSSTEIVVDRTTSISTERDTSIISPSDIASAFLQTTDSAVYILTTGSRMKIDSQQVVIKGSKQASLLSQRVAGTNLIKLDCFCDTMSIAAKLRDTYLKQSFTKRTEQETRKPVRYVPYSIKILAFIGFLTLLATGLYLSFKISKSII